MSLYRFATEADWPSFDRLLREYLLEQEKLGSPVKVSKRSLDVYRDLAHRYLHGGLFGTLVMVGDYGFALAGEDVAPPRIDSSLGKQAVVWITYVDPAYRQQGDGLGMLVFGRPRLLELGFETAVMSVRDDNNLGLLLTERYGARPAERFYTIPLEEIPHGRPVEQVER